MTWSIKAKAVLASVMAVSLFAAVPQAFAASNASDIVSTGKAYLGVPYQFGAKKGDSSHFDCSSYMQYIFAKNGIQLPRSSKQQSKAGKAVSRSDLKPGDLVFFYSPIHHVAVYIGNGKIMHTYGKRGVTIDSITSGWYGQALYECPPGYEQ